ncbi:hypothetical protein J7E63_14750 [Bacillus sp. ISL-75]|uniref:hypothetical protein n=1 Tax=Bacillus sp. ISL-75 TaxID=2819137 RepID=UPI001BED0020|nr:hypothetical protein [Bacillus sp. ISL-75]MBT2728197.1 hypothetical protein [Bacillus sp. ISL-75]
MIGLLIAIITFNYFAFKKNKILSANQIVHIWSFTVSFQVLFDVFIEFKYHGYWYFDREIDWAGLIPHIFLVPAVNMIFLNWFPHKSKVIKQIFFIIIFVIAILIYEAITLLPPPWGFFHYGWWKLWHAAILDPFLLLILLGYYKWICKLEKDACKSSKIKE